MILAPEITLILVIDAACSAILSFPSSLRHSMLYVREDLYFGQAKSLRKGITLPASLLRVSLIIGLFFC